MSDDAGPSSRTRPLEADALGLSETGESPALDPPGSSTASYRGLEDGLDDVTQTKIPLPAPEHDDVTSATAEIPFVADPAADEPVEMDAEELESVDDVSELADDDDMAETGEHIAMLDPEPEPVPEELPRWSLDDSVEASAAAPLTEDKDVDTRTAIRTDDTAAETRTDFVERPRPSVRLPGGPPSVRSSAGPPSLISYRPPAPVFLRDDTPAYDRNPDAEEQALIDARDWNALVSLYRVRVSEADNAAARAALLEKISSVHERELGEPQLAFDAITEAFELRPQDEDIALAVDRLGKATGRIGEIAERTRMRLHTADHELRMTLLGHLVFWYERLLTRSGEAAALAAELEQHDKSHPVSLRRAAQVAAANGDVKSQRELLLRALDRSFRREEKVALHIALASAHAGTPDALKHYEAALAIDPSSIVALQGLERLGREQEKYAQVAWSLDRQTEVAATAAERSDALFKLAELYETRFLKREMAATMLERVLEDEPAHPGALKSLERCYHALRDWPKLARILRIRAENTYDKREKVRLLETAAEVHESKLGDHAGAIEIHRDVLIVEPKHRRALTDLARLYEKIGDWANVATYKARIAEMAPTKKAASRELVQLGDFLMAEGRDEIAARLQYERAVAVDPTNAAAWEAIQRIAAAAGDDRRVEECLENRAKHENTPRQRAAAYVELAQLRARKGDDAGRRAAFEAAIKADPTNETAAIVMLDAYTREEKWLEAAPLCELLVNAAVRDKDLEALFVRHRLATRIFAALGDAERAMTAALAAVDDRPDDRDAQADLVAVCAQCLNEPKVLARASAYLERIAENADDLPPDALLRLAQVERGAGAIDSAAHTLERALALAPDDPEIVRELTEVYLRQGDYPRACKLKVDTARNATDLDTKVGLLVEAGEIWAKKAQELEKAAEIYEEARSLKPLDHKILHTLMWIYGELEAWDRVLDVLEGIEHTQESTDRKVKTIIAMAQVARDKLLDARHAAAFYDRALDLDRKRLDCFEQLVRVLTEAKDWEALERAYRKMLARIKDDANDDLRFALFTQLGLIYRDRLGDAARAYEALEAAESLRADDTQVRKIVTELLVVTDNLDNAVARIRERIARDPHDAKLYAELYELFLRQHHFDKAWCTVNVLASLGELTPEQQRFHEDYPPVPLSDVPGQLVENAWASHVLHAEMDPTLTSVFAIMTPAVARMRHAQLRPEQLVFAVGRPFTAAHSPLHDAIRATFRDAAEILGLPSPELLLGDPKNVVPFAPALSPFGAILVAPPAIEARGGDTLVYMIGKRLAEQRAELCARAFFPSIQDLTALLATAIRVSRQEGAHDAAGAALDASFSAVLTPQERDGLRSILLHATMEGVKVDVKRWSQRADLSSTRAGLLLAGDVEPARRCILAEPITPTDLPPRERIGELYKFATSDIYSDLRGAIGVAVQA